MADRGSKGKAQAERGDCGDRSWPCSRSREWRSRENDVVDLALGSMGTSPRAAVMATGPQDRRAGMARSALCRRRPTGAGRRKRLRLRAWRLARRATQCRTDMWPRGRKHATETVVCTITPVSPCERIQVRYARDLTWGHLCAVRGVAAGDCPVHRGRCFSLHAEFFSSGRNIGMSRLVSRYFFLE